MGHINARTITIKKNNPTRLQKKITLRRVVINNQIQRFHKDAANRRK